LDWVFVMGEVQYLGIMIILSSWIIFLGLAMLGGDIRRLKNKGDKSDE